MASHSRVRISSQKPGRKSMLSKNMIAVLVVTTGLVMLSRIPYQNPSTPSVYAESESLCPQIPGLLNAIEYTLQTWPPETSPVPADVKTSLQYFAKLVRTDNDWCASGATSTQPELIDVTSHWL